MVGAYAAAGTGRPTPGSTELGGDRRLYGLPEQLELVHLIGHGPKEDPLDTGMREGQEILREQLGRADRQAFSEHLESITSSCRCTTWHEGRGRCGPHPWSGCARPRSWGRRQARPCLGRCLRQSRTHQVRNICSSGCIGDVLAVAALPVEAGSVPGAGGGATGVAEAECHASCLARGPGLGGPRASGAWLGLAGR